MIRDLRKRALQKHSLSGPQARQCVNWIVSDQFMINIQLLSSNKVLD